MTALPKAAKLSPEKIARQSKSNFLLSFLFLAPQRRESLRAIYAFCRAVDDAVDDAPDPEQARAALAFWRDELDAAIEGEARTATGRAVGEAVRRFGVAPRHLRAVIDGCSMDIEPRRYATLEELDGYCEKVASAVGLACLPVFGSTGPEAERYAHTLGLALQLTNVLRDLRPDAEEGRVYVPTDRLEAAGVDPEWLAARGPSEVYADGGPVDRLVADLGAVAIARFAAAAEARPADQGRVLLPAEVMAAIYAAVLDAVVQRRGRLDTAPRPRVGKPRKIALVLRTWWRGHR